MSLTHIFVILLSSFALGQIIKRAIPSQQEKIRDLAILLGLRIAIPFSILGAIWDLDLNQNNLILICFIGTTVLGSGFLIGRFIANLQKLPNQQKGVITPAGVYTNIGLGGFIVYAFTGEPGFALVPLYKLFEELIYYGFLFPYAARKSDNAIPTQNKKWWSDPTIWIMASALGVGLLLNCLEFNRPAIVGSWLSFCITAGTFLMMFAIGIIFTTSKIFTKIPLALPIVLCKPVTFLSITLFMLFIFNELFDISNIQLIAQVCIILAVMPCAFVVSVPAAIYKLDKELGNTVWALSTLLFLITLPFIPNILQLANLF